jgi:pyruvate,water dikinase
MRNVATVGGKNASLGELLQSMPGVRVPNGFAVTADGYRHFIASCYLEPKLRDCLRDVDVDDLVSLRRAGESCRRVILSASLPQDLQDQIKHAYEGMERTYGTHTDVAVRSSATAEDLPTASFAGQQGFVLSSRDVT